VFELHICISDQLAAMRDNTIEVRNMDLYGMSMQKSLVQCIPKKTYVKSFD